jgi:hypothetical protein
MGHLGTVYKNQAMQPGTMSRAFTFAQFLTDSQIFEYKNVFYHIASPAAPCRYGMRKKASADNL